METPCKVKIRPDWPKRTEPFTGKPAGHDPATGLSGHADIIQGSRTVHAVLGFHLAFVN